MTSGADVAELAEGVEPTRTRTSVFSDGPRRCVADGAPCGSLRAPAALHGPAPVRSAPSSCLGGGPGAAGPGGGDPADLLPVHVRGAGPCYVQMSPW